MDEAPTNSEALQEALQDKDARRSGTLAGVSKRRAGRMCMTRDLRLHRASTYPAPVRSPPSSLCVAAGALCGHLQDAACSRSQR